MKKILAFLFAVSLFYFVGAQSVLASSLFNVEVRTYLDGSNMNQAASGLSNQARGSKVQFNATDISPEYSFAFYAVNDIVRDDLPQNYEFVVRSNMKITAFFRPNGSVTPAKARHVVIFADNNGKIISGGVQYVADGGTATEPSVLPTKPNADHASPKWFSIDAIEGSLLNIDSSRVYLLQYVSTNNTEYTVNVTGGSVVEVGPYNYNEVVTLQPNAAPAEQVFSHWEDAEGNVLSTKANYKFTVMGNVSVQAVFAASPEFSGVVVNMSDALSIRSGYVTYKGQFDLPAGFTLVEYGFIFSRSSDVLTLDSLGATIVPSNVHNGQTGEFLRSFPNDTFNSVRAYLIVKNASEQEVIVYSDNYYRNPNTIQGVPYSTGLENLTGRNPLAYAATSITIDGLLWNTYQTYIANDDSNDKKQGNYSFRLRSEFDVNIVANIWTATKISELSQINFSYAWYGTHTEGRLSVALSIDGSSWVDVASDLVPTSTLTAHSIVIDYNDSDLVNNNITINTPVHVKFYVKNYSNNNARSTNLDDISFVTGNNNVKHEVIYNNTTLPTEFVVNSSLINQSTPLQTGYSFIGWYTNIALTQTYNVSTPVVQSIQLYAKWEINQYIISFDSNEGSSVGAITQDYNTSVTEPSEPTRTGYTFAGWYTDDNTFLSEYVFTTMPSSNITLYAKWNVNNYTISFDSDGGSAVSPITQAFGTSVLAPSAPLKSGYEFVGWFSDVELTSAYTFSTMPAQNITLYAKWDVYAGETYSVQFDVNGGSPSIDSQVIPENSTAVEPTDPTKEGYRFVEWQLDGEPFNFATPITGDITLIALWIQQFTVTFDVDGGSAVTAQVVDSGSLASQPDPSPTKSGNSFAGWFTTSAKDVSFNFATMIISENTTIYAKWNQILSSTFLGSSMSTALGTTSNTALTDGLAHTTPEPDIDYATGFGLNTEIFNVSLAKNFANAFAINNGVLRGYYNASGGGAITISTTNAYTILSITINIKGANGAGANSLSVNRVSYAFNLATNSSTTSISANNINSSSVIIQCTHVNRMYIESIVINYQLNP